MNLCIFRVLNLNFLSSLLECEDHAAESLLQASVDPGQHQQLGAMAIEKHTMFKITHFAISNRKKGMLRRRMLPYLLVRINLPAGAGSKKLKKRPPSAKLWLHPSTVQSLRVQSSFHDDAMSASGHGSVVDDLPLIASESSASTGVYASTDADSPFNPKQKILKQSVPVCVMPQILPLPRSVTWLPIKYVNCDLDDRLFAHSIPQAQFPR
jgi:hypothetical protein